MDAALVTCMNHRTLTMTNLLKLDAHNYCAPRGTAIHNGTG